MSSSDHSANDIVNNPPKDKAGKVYSNVMYAFHFYAASHRDNYRNAVRTYAAKIPIFASEWGACEASGNGNVDAQSTNQWLVLMKELGISWCAWNWSDKGESSALLVAGACEQGKNQWTGSALSKSGQLVMEALR